MRYLRRSGLLILAAACLSGCATNTIRIDRGATMVDAGREAIGATRDTMRQAQAENRAALIDLVASDPQCRLPAPVIGSGDSRGLCSADGTIRAGSSDFIYPRITRRDFGPSLAVIDGLVAYLDTVDAVIVRDPVDLGGNLLDAEAELRSIFEDVATIAGGSGPGLPTITADQKAAVKSVLDLIGELIDEQARVDDLRRIELKLDPDAFAKSLEQLSKINTQWLATYEGQLDSRIALVKRRLPRIAAADYDRRLALASAQMALIERQEATPELAAALRRTVSVLGQAHADYRALLFGSGRQMTAAERQKAAAITRARVRAALRSLAAVVRAF